MKFRGSNYFGILVTLLPRDYHQCAAGEIFLNFRAIFGQKIGKNDKNLKLFFKIFWHRPPFSQQISENKIRQRWSKNPFVCSKLFKQEGVSRVLSTVTLTEKNFFCNRHRLRHRKKIFLSPSPKKSFLVTITVNKSFCHRNRWAVTVTTVFSPPVTCHR